MALNFIAPKLKDGEHIIELNKEEVERETTQWKNALILYVIGYEPTIAALERFISNQ